MFSEVFSNCFWDSGILGKLAGDGDCVFSAVITMITAQSFGLGSCNFSVFSSIAT